MSTDGTGTATLSDQVAEEVLSLMGRRRINKAELARRLGAKQDWVGRRLNGRQPFDVDDLQRIAVILGVEPADLLPKPVTRQFRSSVLGIGERVVAVGGDERPSRTVLKGGRGAKRPHRPGRAVSQTRPLSPLLV